jgi:brefeldin A-inhibited guanine nucleotide-exchange protein
VGVHGWSLLQAVSTCYQIFLSNPSASNSAADETNRVTAKATLTQIANLVFQRMEHFAAQLRQIQSSQQQPQQQPQPQHAAGTADAQQQQPQKAGATLNGPGTPSTSPLATPSPDVSPSANGEPSPSPSPTQAGVEGAPQSQQQPQSQGAPQPGRRGFCVWCSKPANHFCLQTKESVCSMECKLSNLRAKDPDDALAAALRRKVQLQAELCQNDAYYLLRALCKLAIKSMPSAVGLGQDGVPRDAAGLIAVDSKILTLQLLLSILSNAGPTFRTSKHFLATVKGDLVNCLLRNSAASSIETIFALSSSLFVALVCHFKPHLHAVLGPVLGSIYLPYIASPNSTFEHKYISLTVLHKLCSDPQTLVELFVNYDCDETSVANVFQMIANTLEKVCRSRLVSENWLSALEEGRLRLLALEALVDTIKSLLTWTKHAQANLLANKAAEAAAKAAKAADGYDSDEEQSAGLTTTRGTPGSHGSGTRHLSNASSSNLVAATPSTSSSSNNLNSEGVVSGGAHSTDKMAHFHNLRAARAKLDTGILKFNMKPKKGLAYLASHKLVDPDSAASVADFFLANAASLDKVTMGEFMGDEADFNKQVLYAYTERLDFRNLAFDQAIRKFLSGQQTQRRENGQHLWLMVLAHGWAWVSVAHHIFFLSRRAVSRFLVARRGSKDRSYDGEVRRAIPQAQSGHLLFGRHCVCACLFRHHAQRGCAQPHGQGAHDARGVLPKHARHRRWEGRQSGVPVGGI